MLFDFATEELVPKSRAMEVTKPFWADLTEVWQAGYRDYGSIQEEIRAKLWRTKFVPPITMFGLAQARAYELFEGREAEGIVRCDGLAGIFGFYIQGEVLIRFNQFDNTHVVRNIDKGSGRKFRYFNQEYVDGIDNRATRLTVGCVADASKTRISSVVISCQKGDVKVYSFPIDGTESIQLPTSTSSPMPDAPGSVSQELMHKLPR